MDFIEEQRDVYGVEPICRVLPIAPSTYHQRALEAREPERASARSKTDAALRVEITRVWEENRQLYGARKVWHALRREGLDVARCTVERLMKSMGIKGVVRGRRIITTNPDAARPCPDDKVKRQFKAQRPNQLWVSDFTYVPTWSGTVYVAFVIDVFARRIVGWRVSTSMSTQFVLDALDQAIWQRKTTRTRLDPSLGPRFAIPLDHLHRAPRRGRHRPVGRNRRRQLDNALAECVIGLFKTEVINVLGPWRTLRDVEWQALRWIDWYNNRRLLAPMG